MVMSCAPYKYDENSKRHLQFNFVRVWLWSRTFQFLDKKLVDRSRVIQIHWTAVEYFEITISNDGDKPWWPALLTMYILPWPFPACLSRSTLCWPPTGSIQSWSPSRLRFGTDTTSSAWGIRTNKSNGNLESVYPIHNGHPCMCTRF